MIARIAIILCLVCCPIFAQPLPTGLGHSTYTCLDKDGDGYGRGRGCLGIDADDNDPTVQTAAQGIAKYGSFTVFLAHLGYAPNNIWYVSPSGNDSTGVKNDVTHPFLTLNAFAAQFGSGDCLMMRGGWVSQTVTPVNGTAGHPTILMAYPGEEVIFDTGAAISMQDKSWIVVDGVEIKNGSSIQGGTTDGSSSVTFHDNIYRNVEGNGAYGSGTLGPIQDFNGLRNFTIEDSILHDNAAGQHEIYIGSRGLASSNVFIHRNIIYNSSWNGMHVNGRVTNLQIDQNLVYSVGISGISLNQGISNSFIRSNVIVNPATDGIEISNYESGTCSDPLTPICPFDQNNNLIENNTIYETGSNSSPAYAMGTSRSTPAIKVQNTSTGTVGDLGHNTFRNNIFVGGMKTSTDLAVVAYTVTPTTQSSQYFATSTFDNNIYYTPNRPSENRPFIVNGVAYYTCAQAAAVTTIVNGCTIADPLFSAASASYYSSIPSFNLHLRYTSPATHAGSITGLPVYDMIGNAYGVRTPSIGAFEYTSTYAQGWNDLLNTHLQSACPPNGYGFSTAASYPGTPPSLPFTVTNAIGGGTTVQANYSFSDLCFNVIANESGGAFDSTRNRLIIWGGGHGGTSGNEIYALNLSPATPTLTRIKDPSIFDQVQNNLGSSRNPPGTAFSTDLAIHGTDATKVCAGTWSGSTCTPGSHTFVTGATTDVWAALTITSGTGCTAKPYTVIAVSGGSATLDSAAGTPGSVCSYFEQPQEQYPSDGAPTPRHTGQGLVYFPTIDKMLAWEGPSVGGPGLLKTWLLDTSTLVWGNQTPTSLAGGGTDITRAPGSNDGAQLAYDPNTQKAFGLWGSVGSFISYTPSTNVWKGYIGGPACGGFVNCLAGAAGTAVVDPVRKLWFYIGNSNNGAPGTPIIWMVDISGSTYTMVDKTPAATGCAGIAPPVTGSAAGGISPGVVYDPVIDRIVIYPNDGNTIYLYNPDTNSCTTQTFPNGPPASGLVQPNGTYGRFVYSPQLDAFAIVNKASNDAYLLSLNLPAPATAALTITPAALPQTTIGATYSQSLASQVSGGAPAYGTYVVATGALPTGVTLNASTGLASGVVSGSPGVKTFTWSVTDSALNTVTSASETITVNAAPVITTASPLNPATYGVSISQTLAATGGTLPLTWSALPGLPTGISLSATGVVSGTPAQGGQAFSVTATVTDAVGISGTKSFSINVNPLYTYGNASITPTNCTHTNAIYAPLDLNTCTIPGEVPLGAFSIPAVGSSYIDPNFGTPVTVLSRNDIQGPSLTSYATPSAWSATGKYASIAVNTATTIIDPTNGTVIRGPGSSPPAPGFVTGDTLQWDKSNDDYYYYFSSPAKLMRASVATGLSTQLIDFTTLGLGITNVGTNPHGDISDDNWLGCFSSGSGPMLAIAVNLNNLHIYTIDATILHGSFSAMGLLGKGTPSNGTVIISKGRDSVSGKRYVLAVTYPVVIYSLNAAGEAATSACGAFQCGSLTYEELGPEYPKSFRAGAGNDDNICTTGEDCIGVQHNDMFQAKDGQQYLATMLDGDALIGSSFRGMVYIRLNAGNLMLRSSAFEGGGRTDLPVWFSQAVAGDPFLDVHIGCASGGSAAPYCVASSYPSPARNAGDFTSPYTNTAHFGVEFVLKGVGEEVRQLTKSRSISWSGSSGNIFSTNCDGTVCTVVTTAAHNLPPNNLNGTCISGTGISAVDLATAGQCFPTQNVNSTTFTLNRPVTASSTTGTLTLPYPYQYWPHPFASISPDGSRILYNTNLDYYTADGNENVVTAPTGFAGLAAPSPLGSVKISGFVSISGKASVE
jgi:hypothetical protein